MDQNLAQEIVGASLDNDNRMLAEYFQGSSVIERDTLKLLWKLGDYYEVTMKVNYKIEE